MSAEYFIDTNVFIYLFDETDERKRKSAEHLIHQALVNGNGCISYQVVQEAINVLIKGLNVSSDNVREILEHVLLPLLQVYPSQAIYHRSLDLHARYGFSYYDSLIIAAAIDAGCENLYTEDLQHGQRIEGLSIRNPFEN